MSAVHSITETQTQVADIKARKALALIIAGNDSAGLDLYKQCLRLSGASAMPIGRHLEFLKRVGKTESAAALRDLCCLHGFNIARRGVALDGTQVDPIAEYEPLFAQGLINPRMVKDYAIKLSQLNQTDRVTSLFDPDLLLRTVHLDSALAPAARNALLREEPNAEYREANYSARDMSRIYNLPTRDESLQELFRALRFEAERYVADWAASHHPLASHVPKRVDIGAWGQISRGVGFNVPHVHHLGWATGVYYPADLDQPPPGGELCVGRPEGVAIDAPGWPDVSIRPEAGLLVLMPSFYTHWTVPLASPGLRMSIAFDVRATELSRRRMRERDLRPNTA